MNDICKTCGRWMMFPSPHKCAPAWECAREDGFEYGIRKIYGVDEEDAAEKFAERDDANSAEYPEDRIVLVRPASRDGPVKKFNVTLESTPVYSAHEIKAIDKAEKS